jgi:hypothetical protein
VWYAEHRSANRGQNVVIIIVANVESEIALYTLDRAWPHEAARTAGPDAVIHRVQGQMLGQVPGT